MAVVVTSQLPWSGRGAEQSEVLSVNWTAFLVLNLILTGAVLVPQGIPYLFLLMIPYLMRGPTQAIQVLSISWLFGFLNPELFVLPASLVGMRWIILFAVFARLGFDFLLGRIRISETTGALLLYVSTILILALLISYAPLISIFKAVSFAIGGLTTLLAFRSPEAHSEYLRSWFYTFFVVLMVWSLPLYFVPSIGGAVNGTFQGVLSQPQAFGVFLAPMVAWLTTVVILGRKSVWPVTLTILGWMSLFASASRTALLATVIAVALALLVNFWHRADVRHLVKRPIVLVATAILVSLTVLFIGALGEYTVAFLAKNQEGDLNRETLGRSRGLLITTSLNNFRSHPLAGIGFGMASDPALLDVSRDSWFGLPISASVEKGFMPSGVLEETGILGTVSLLFLLGTLIRGAVRQNLGMLSLLFSYLLTNLGEATFFSMAGMGLYGWLLIGLSCASAGRASTRFRRSSLATAPIP